MKHVTFWLKLAFAGTALGYLGSQGTLKLNWAELNSEAFIMLAIGTAFLVSSCIVGFFRWWVFVKGNQVSFKTVWTLSWAGCFVNTCVPGGVGGDLMRGILLGGRFTKAQGLASVAADRGIAIVALVVLNGVFLITDSSTLQAAAHYRWAAIFFVALSVLMALVVLVGPKLNKGLKTWLAPWKGQGWRWGGGLALALLGHVLTCVGLVFYLKALPGVQPELSRYLSHLPLALALAGIPALPGGLGIGHLAFAGILGMAGAERAADLYTLYALHLFLLAMIGVASFLSLKIPLKQILRYNQS